MPEPTSKTNIDNGNIYVWKMNGGRSVKVETRSIPGDVSTVGIGGSITTIQSASPDSLVRNISFDGYTQEQIEKRSSIRNIYSEKEDKENQLKLLGKYKNSIESKKWTYADQISLTYDGWLDERR